MSKRQVTKKGYSKDISYNERRILSLLSKGINSPTKIAKDLKISRKTVYKHINRLIKLRKYGKMSGVTQKGYTTLGYSPQKDCWRYNGVQIYYHLPKDIDTNAWKKYKGKVLALKKVSHDEAELDRQKVQQFYLRNKYFTRFFNKGIMIYAPNFFGRTKEEAHEKMAIWMMHIAEQLKKITGINFMRSNEVNVSIVKCELSRLRDGVAKSLRLSNKKVYVNVDGRLRIGFDFSHGIDERETFTADYERQDHEIMETVVRDYITKPCDTPAKTKSRMDRVETVIEKMAENTSNFAEQSGMYAQEIAEHRKAIKQMTSTLLSIQKAMEGLNK